MYGDQVKEISIHTLNTSGKLQILPVILKQTVVEYTFVIVLWKTTEHMNLSLVPPVLFNFNVCFLKTIPFFNW